MRRPQLTLELPLLVALPSLEVSTAGMSLCSPRGDAPCIDAAGQLSLIRLELTQEYFGSIGPLLKPHVHRSCIASCQYAVPVLPTFLLMFRGIVDSLMSLLLLPPDLLLPSHSRSEWSVVWQETPEFNCVQLSFGQLIKLLLCLPEFSDQLRK